MAYAHKLRIANAVLPPFLALLAVIAVAAVVLMPGGAVRPVISDMPVVETVRVPAGEVVYREAGAFALEGHEIDAPVTRAATSAPIEVMKYQVSAAQYAQCVTDGACAPADGPMGANGDLPVTGISYLDAAAYTEWFSAATGQSWRLPTDLEWALFASLEIEDGAVSAERSMADRWLDTYREMATRDRAADKTVRPRGYFGENALGIADIEGNVWEWTETCFARVNLNAAGNVLSRLETCGVRVLQGQHRSYMTAFVRDAISGGCAVGTPPDHLGMRLVREIHWTEDLLRLFD